jgi:hypothetical protein
MSEASWEEQKKQVHEAKKRALHARYQLLKLDDNDYGVITVYSWELPSREEYVIYRFVAGLERVNFDKATSAVVSLNRGDTKEDSQG